MSHARLHAPTEDRAILAEPSLADAARIVAGNRDHFAGWTHDFQGRAASHVRAITRSAVLNASHEYCGIDPQSSILDVQTSVNLQSRRAGTQTPSTLDHQPFIVSGHQPELFHPGVWVKNFAAHAIARSCGGVPLHLIVDTDTVKGTTVRVPTGSVATPSVVHVPFDRWQGEVPFEEYEVSDETAFASFGDRVCEAMRPLGVMPLAEQFWPHAKEATLVTRRLGERIARARRQQEAAWGAASLELPVSRLCQTEGFYWFASHVLAQLGRFREVYNQSLDDYRRVRRIRSRNRPVPPLARDGDWLEAPFRVWTADRPRRRPLFVQQLGREMLLTDRDGWTARLPLAPDREACCAVEVLGDLARQGIKLRTRALTTTIFTRLCVADLFIHGLGGALYDEVANVIIRRFFGIDPPGFLTLTGTLHLPIAAHEFTAADAQRLKRLARDLVYNPDRHLGPAADRPELARLVDQKHSLIRSLPTTRLDRRQRFEQIRHINESLSPAVADAWTDTAQQIESVRAALAANDVLRNREWAFCLYPPETLREFVRPFVE